MWRDKQYRDPWYAKAKLEGYRSRSAYKLLEMQEKFGLIKSFSNVLDLGCAPGGWLQVCRNLTKGKVYGIDITKVNHIPNVTFIQHDMRDSETIEKILFETGGINKFDVILSDMAPNVGGDKNSDHCRSIELSTIAFEFMIKYLKPNGSGVIKVLDGSETQGLIAAMKEHGMYRSTYKAKTSRRESSEIFIILRGYSPK